MLRMYLLQVWFNLADEAVEEQIYDSYARRNFMGIDFTEEGVPDATTLLKFRHFLEKHGLQKMLFDTVSEALDEAGKIMHGGTIVDATIIEAPSSTKNSAKSRDPEMHQAKKGNEWHFGMKAHIGVDAGSGMVHSVETSAANVADIETAHKLIREDDEVVNADAGYAGIEKRKEIAENEQLSKVEYRINRKKGELRKREAAIYKEPEKHLEYIGEPQWEREIEYKKSKVRSKVEHIFYILDLLGNYFVFSKLIRPQIKDIRNPKRLRRLRYLLDVILNTFILALICSMRMRSRKIRRFSAFSPVVSSPSLGFFFGVSLFWCNFQIP
jgi:IS5 family transposase